MLPWSSEDAVTTSGRSSWWSFSGTCSRSWASGFIRSVPSGTALRWRCAAQPRTIFDTAATGQSQPGVALLGEIGKVTAVSTFRFAAVGLGSTGGSLEVELRGSPDELVTLLFAREATTAPGTAASASSQDFDCIFVNATIAANSTAFVSFSLVA